MNKLLDYALVLLCVVFFLAMATLGYFMDPHAGIVQLIAVPTIACAIAAITGYLGESVGASMPEHIIAGILIVVGIVGGAWAGSHLLDGVLLAVAALICFMLRIITDSGSESDRPDYRKQSNFG